MVNIAVYSQASTPLGLSLINLTAALQRYVNDFVCPAWNTPATLTAAFGPVPGSWGLVFEDDADVSGALAYHTVQGLPLSKVFVRTILNNGETISGAASHELSEMLVDSGCEKTATRADGVQVALECADACEETSFNVDGFSMSDFCLPAYFDPTTPVGTLLDHCNVLSKPFEIATGGYLSLLQNGQWSQVFGSLDKQARFAKEDRRGHRTERRQLCTP